MSSYRISLSGTVLLVDDDSSTRAAFAAILTPLGHLVFAAENGAVALESLHLALPDVVVTDIEMPSLNGVELCSAIRNDPSLRHLPVIAVSSAKLDAASESALFNVCLRKPVSPQQLLSAISPFLKSERLDSRSFDSPTGQNSAIGKAGGPGGFVGEAGDRGVPANVVSATAAPFSAVSTD